MHCRNCERLEQERDDARQTARASDAQMVVMGQEISRLYARIRTMQEHVCAPALGQVHQARQLSEYHQRTGRELAAVAKSLAKLRHRVDTAARRLGGN